MEMLSSAARFSMEFLIPWTVYPYRCVMSSTVSASTSVLLLFLFRTFCPDKYSRKSSFFGCNNKSKVCPECGARGKVRGGHQILNDHPLGKRVSIENLMEVWATHRPLCHKMSQSFTISVRLSVTFKSWMSARPGNCSTYLLKMMDVRKWRHKILDVVFGSTRTWWR